MALASTLSDQWTLFDNGILQKSLLFLDAMDRHNEHRLSRSKAQVYGGDNSACRGQDIGANVKATCVCNAERGESREAKKDYGGHTPNRSHRLSR